MPCGISTEGLDVLAFLQKRGGTWHLRKFVRFWRYRVDNLDALLDDLSDRGLIVITRDGRSEVIRIYNRAEVTNIIIQHDYFIPPHHRQRTHQFE